jgi:hypothetical protein
MNYFNQHSFTLSAIIVYAVVAVTLLRDGVRFFDVVALVVMASAFGLSWLLLRPGPSTLTKMDAVEAGLAAGQPTLLEFQSEY